VRLGMVLGRAIVRAGGTVGRAICRPRHSSAMTRPGRRRFASGKKYDTIAVQLLKKP
jgi:hypothetical protein